MTIGYFQMTIGHCHVKAGDFRMTSGFLITMGGPLIYTK